MKTNPERIQVKAAGGLVFRVRDQGGVTPDVLLIYRNNCWDLPKGKLEENESIPECALREVQEELGLEQLPEILADIGTTFHTYSQNSKTFEKETFWFVMRLMEDNPKFSPQLKEGITKTDWVPADTAIERVEFQNLKDIINRFIRDLPNLKKADRHH